MFKPTTKVPLTPDRFTDRLTQFLPKPLTATDWDDYGLTRIGEQPDAVVKEMLSLALYWMKSAMDAHYAGIAEVLLWPRLLERVADAWQPTYALAISDWDGFLAELPNRMGDYFRVTEQGGSALSVCTEACAYLEGQWAVRGHEQPALLALFTDSIASEAIGRVFETTELVAPNS